MTYRIQLNDTDALFSTGRRQLLQTMVRCSASCRIGKSAGFANKCSRLGMSVDEPTDEGFLGNKCCILKYCHLIKRRGRILFCKKCGDDFTDREPKLHSCCERLTHEAIAAGLKVHPGGSVPPTHLDSYPF